MTRRPTLSELIWPNDPADADLPVKWAQDVAVQALGWTWRGFDALRGNQFDGVDLAQPLEQLERDLTSKHFIQIQFLFAAETGGFSALSPVHEHPELETRSAPPAKPPAYDLGFVCPGNQRWVWPIEAKVLSTPNALAEYLKDVREKYIAGIDAPFVGEGGMIGYLQKGLPTDVFRKLDRELGQTLTPHPDFPTRNQRSSRHARSSAPVLTLHHLIMDLTPAAN
jgi:hypothetical protein